MQEISYRERLAVSKSGDHDVDVQCGSEAKPEGALCPNGLCCSKFGFCGTTEPYCKIPGCQSQCTPTPPAPTPTPPSPTPPGPTPPGPSGDLSDIFSRDQFYKMLKHMNDNACPARGFFTYDAFITAAKFFPSFGNTGDLATRKKEIAAFFGQTSHETTEHPNDEEEVEGIDLHQQRYPWEGSDMDYLYDESSFAQLLSMELTLEIDGAIFHVPNANASSNVDSQL
ncbi:hypothetical protein F2Q70_00009867 [Brassica cretica]|uniref:chitinase n=1 Tax=Brassica cretica TaxID=69181 RepID=A0A8S9LV46_BRACR|nr:hypothetical protein F2Q70_00009867 [Brassica cretica]